MCLVGVRTNQLQAVVGAESRLACRRIGSAYQAARLDCGDHRCTHHGTQGWRWVLARLEGWWWLPSGRHGSCGPLAAVVFTALVTKKVVRAPFPPVISDQIKVVRPIQRVLPRFPAPHVLGGCPDKPAASSGRC
jgi:hypothetical protein